MQIQIKTLSQKSINIDIDDTMNVFQLKQELSNNPDIGVKPELQKLIYAGRVLLDEEIISECRIDLQKFVVVLLLKKPQEGTPTTSHKATETATSTAKEKATVTSPESKISVKKELAKTATAAIAEFKTPPTATAAAAATTTTPSEQSDRRQMIENIVSMGYPESEVCRALAVSFYNPERAIEYLIEGIPPNLERDTDGTYNELSPLQLYRSDPLFRNLRRTILQHPELMDETIERVGESNPAILRLITENHEEFLNMLVDDDEDLDD